MISFDEERKMIINLISPSVQVRLEKLGACVSPQGVLTATEEQMWQAPLNPYTRVQLEKSNQLIVGVCGSSSASSTYYIYGF
jgi:hypothetical protein